MKAACVTRFGGSGVLEIRDVPEPKPGEREILVKVRAIGLNFADLFARMGVYPGIPKPPFVPGMEFSGEVVSTGTGVTSLGTGDRVMGFSRLGSHAEYTALREDLAVRLPAGMSFEEGASFPVSYMTAYHGLVRLANLSKGEKLLVHAAAGGVGIASLQIAKRIGAEVFATAGSDEKVGVARQQGAQHVINYRTADFALEIRRITGGYGVDVVMDSVGGSVFGRSWALLAEMGRYVLFGISSVTGSGGLNRLRAARSLAAMHPIFPSSIIGLNKGFFGFNLGTLHGKEKYLRQVMEELLKFYNEGSLHPYVGKVFPFSEIVEAHQFLQSRRSVGKVVVRVGN